MQLLADDARTPSTLHPMCLLSEVTLSRLPELHVQHCTRPDIYCPFCAPLTIFLNSYSLVNSRLRVLKSLTRSRHVPSSASLGVIIPSVRTWSSNLGNSGCGTFRSVSGCYSRDDGVL